MPESSGKIRVGVSGWSYDSWNGAFYPEGLPARRRLEYASRRFQSIEINGSFYALQKPHSYRAWHEATPAKFKLAVKGSRFITHNKKLGDVETALANFFASGILLLGEKLGPILWQLPRQLAFDAGRMQAFFDLLPGDTFAAAKLARRHDERVEGRCWTKPIGKHRLRYAIEPRHESFFGPDFVRIARHAGVAIAFADSGSWPYTEEPTAGFVYMRLHGSPATYASRYSGTDIARWATRIRAWRRGAEPAGAKRITDLAPPRRKARDVYVYFDNDHNAYAPRNALELIDRLGLHAGS
ncbi:MAG TPA: DUF72 domain-containing protein [Gemmatimonadota bacterium]|nr:DUF72 domain-containing protein [Gemmatimonadota bacterium]